MRFVHLSDLHLGKRVNEFSMLEDQEYILNQIIEIIDEQSPQCCIIAGDIYDKAVPSAEAVELFDNFLCALARRKLQVFIISGNHDSPERIAFGSRLIDGSGIHLSPVYNGVINPFTMNDSFGQMDLYMLPFIKPAHVRRFFPDEQIESYTDALRVAIDKMDVDKKHRNILVTHQFVTGALRSESEEISVGGTDNVDAAVFSDFDYVALGHIHGPQSVGRETVRYCGTPLKYSFSEVSHEKSVTVFDINEKGNISIETVELSPLRDMRKIRGSYMELTAKSAYEGTNTDDYMHITLTDEEDIPDAVNKLRVIYPNLMKLEYDNKRTQSAAKLCGDNNIEEKSPIELFGEFYLLQNGQDMSQEQFEFANRLINDIWEDNI